MDKAIKYFLIFVMGIIALPGILYLLKCTKNHGFKQTGERIGSGMDEMLKESKTALDKATSQIQSALTDIQSRSAAKAD